MLKVRLTIQKSLFRNSYWVRMCTNELHLQSFKDVLSMGEPYPSGPSAFIPLEEASCTPVPIHT